MTWHVVCRSGVDDDYQPAFVAGDGLISIAAEGTGAPDAMRSNFAEVFREALGRAPDGIAVDLLTLASAVFTADLCMTREMGIDRWSREIALHLPVEDTATWDGAADTITELLGFLTGDHWSIEFRERSPGAGLPVVVGANQPDVVSLFSGGLDSLVGVIDLLADGKRVALVGHYGAGMTHTYQERVAAVLEQEYPGEMQPLLFHAQPPVIQGMEGREQTMRSRSFLFFSLGVCAGNLIGHDVPLYVPENGLISLNVPLTNARSGSLSTRTTHPYYVAKFRELLAILGIGNPVVLPYRLKTKGQMLAECADQETLGKAAPLTMSCAHSEGGRWEGNSPGTHCGYCFPCLIRRAAIAAAGTPDAPYGLNVLTDPPDPTTARGRDFRALSMAVARFSTRPAGRAIFDVLDSGPIPPEDIAAYTTTYRNGMKELGDFLAPEGA